MKSNTNWLRLVSEGIAIVVSILLALAVDAWWEERQKSHAEQQLLRSLKSDFLENDRRIKGHIKLESRLANAISDLLDQMGSVEEGEPITVADSLLAAVLPSPTFDPVKTTLEASASAGLIQLIRSEEVRNELANWQSVADDTRQDELAVRKVVNDLLLPEFKKSVQLAHLYDHVVAWSVGNLQAAQELANHQTISVSLDMTNAVATQLFNIRFVMSGLKEMEQVQDRLLQTIEIELQ